MIFIAIFLWLSCLTKGIYPLILKDVSVPEVVILDGEEPDRIVLDCQYDIGDTYKTLVVKWSKDNNAVYQWIRGQKPSVIPKYINRVDEYFSISEEPNQAYRALVLIDPDIETSGNYKCVVQTEKETYSMEKHLQIVDISNYTVYLYNYRYSNETHLECTVQNVYPEPKLIISSDNDDPVSVLSFIVHAGDDGYYNATSIAVVANEEVDSNEFKCVIHFAGISYNITKTFTSGENTITLSKALFLFNLIYLLIKFQFWKI